MLREQNIEVWTSHCFCIFFTEPEFWGLNREKKRLSRQVTLNPQWDHIRYSYGAKSNYKWNKKSLGQSLPNMRRCEKYFLWCQQVRDQLCWQEARYLESDTQKDHAGPELWASILNLDCALYSFVELFQMNSLDPCEKREMCMNDGSARARGALSSLQITANPLFVVQLRASSAHA